MKIRFLIVAAALLSCSGQVGAEKVVVGNPGAKTATAITLHKATPSSIAWALGLFSFADFKSGNTKMWTRDQKAVPAGVSSPGRPMVQSEGSKTRDMSGIELVVPCDDEGVLVVYGERGAVDKLKTAVSRLDVPCEQVQVKAEFWAIGIEGGKKLDLDTVSQAAISGSELEEFRASMREGSAEIVNSAVFNTLSDVPGEVSASLAPRLLQAYALPRINTDGTITTVVNLAYTEDGTTPERCTQELFTQRRTADGETVVLGGFVTREQTRRMLLVLLTSKILD